MRTLVYLWAVVSLAISGWAQIGSNCGEHPKLLRDTEGKFVIFTPQKLVATATEKVKPKLPSLPASFHYDGDATFKLIVGTQGNVVCIWDTMGHPLMIPAADEAGRWWKFKPMAVKGKPVEYIGELKFHFSTTTGADY